MPLASTIGCTTSRRRPISRPSPRVSAPAFASLMLFSITEPRHRRQFACDRLAHRARISRCADAVRLGCLRHRTQAQPRQQFVGRLFLQGTDRLQTRQRGVVLAVEKVEPGQQSEQVALGRLVGDLVVRQHRLGVAPQLGGKGRELVGRADDVLDLGVELVAESRQVGRLLDARLARRRRLCHHSRRQHREGASQRGTEGPAHVFRSWDGHRLSSVKNAWLLLSRPRNERTSSCGGNWPPLASIVSR